MRACPSTNTTIGTASRDDTFGGPGSVEFMAAYRAEGLGPIGGGTSRTDFGSADGEAGGSDAR
jgi:hypothetical protein